MDKELLLKPRLAEADVDLPGVGTVRVRALSRIEQLSVVKATDQLETVDGTRALAIERKLIAVAMLDPTLSEDEVQRWQEASPAGELAPVALTIQHLSGMLEGAAKEAYAAFRDGSDGRVRLLSGGSAADAGGGDAGAAVG